MSTKKEEIDSLKRREYKLSSIMRWIETNNKGKELHYNTKKLYETARIRIEQIKKDIRSLEKTVWSK